jgi:hypothetical protein
MIKPCRNSNCKVSPTSTTSAYLTLPNSNGKQKNKNKKKKRKHEFVLHSILLPAIPHPSITQPKAESNN